MPNTFPWRKYVSIHALARIGGHVIENGWFIERFVALYVFLGIKYVIQQKILVSGDMMDYSSAVDILLTLNTCDVY